VYAPVSGTVVEVNTELGESPQRLNEDPYGEGWLCLISTDELNVASSLLDPEAYRKLIES
jgi:glycine cleavage system H protein